MNVLVACDIQKPSGGHPEWHILDDVHYISCSTSKNKGNKDKMGVSRAGGAQKIRSKTFEGIAAAMAEQWGDYVNDKLQYDKEGQ